MADRPKRRLSDPDHPQEPGEISSELADALAVASKLAAGEGGPELQEALEAVGQFTDLATTRVPLDKTALAGTGVATEATAAEQASASNVEGLDDTGLELAKELEEALRNLGITLSSDDFLLDLEEHSTTPMPWGLGLTPEQFRDRSLREWLARVRLWERRARPKGDRDSATGSQFKKNQALIVSIPREAGHSVQESVPEPMRAETEPAEMKSAAISREERLPTLGGGRRKGAPKKPIAEKTRARHKEMGSPKTTALVCDELAEHSYPDEYAKSKPYSPARKRLRDRVRRQVKNHPVGQAT